jgi:hypothetical protein
MALLPSLGQAIITIVDCAKKREPNLIASTFFWVIKNFFGQCHSQFCRAGQPLGFTVAVFLPIDHWRPFWCFLLTQEGEGTNVGADSAAKRQATYCGSRIIATTIYNVIFQAEGHIMHIPNPFRVIDQLIVDQIIKLSSRTSGKDKRVLPKSPWEAWYVLPTHATQLLGYSHVCAGCLVPHGSRIMIHY